MRAGRLVVLVLAVLCGLLVFLAVRGAGDILRAVLQLGAGTAHAALELPGDAWRWARSTTRRVLRLEEARQS